MTDFKSMPTILAAALESLAELQRGAVTIGVEQLNAICDLHTPRDPGALARLREECPDVAAGVKRLRRFKAYKGRSAEDLTRAAVLFAVRPTLYRTL